jgi:hypothetical protein
MQRLVRRLMEFRGETCMGFAKSLGRLAGYHLHRAVVDVLVAHFAACDYVARHIFRAGLCL